MEPRHSKNSPRQAGTLDSWLTVRPRTHTVNTTPRAPGHEEGSQTSHGGSRRSVGGGFRELNRDPSRRAGLAAVAKETRTVLPGILERLPTIRASKSEVMHLSTFPGLQASECPRRTPSGKTRIKVVNEDTLNAAIALATKKSSKVGERVAVLNMASDKSPGGGWINGAMAQEEALCYRSSLALSLHKRYYPWKQRMGVYTPDTVIIRSDIPSGHKLLIPDTPIDDLPVVSVLSIAALRCPETRRVTQTTSSGEQVHRAVYANPASRELTKDKMRLCLRMAARRGHGLLVLGALGCGAFRNPRREVARCWLEVFAEPEFQGGWWQEVWFAVYDTKNEGNFDVFDEMLSGVEV